MWSVLYLQPSAAHAVYHFVTRLLQQVRTPVGKKDSIWLLNLFPSHNHFVIEVNS